MLICDHFFLPLSFQGQLLLIRKCFAYLISFYWRSILHTIAILGITKISTKTVKVSIRLLLTLISNKYSRLPAKMICKLLVKSIGKDNTDYVWTGRLAHLYVVVEIFIFPG